MTSQHSIRRRDGFAAALRPLRLGREQRTSVALTDGGRELAKPYTAHAGGTPLSLRAPGKLARRRAMTTSSIDANSLRLRSALNLTSACVADRVRLRRMPRLSSSSSRDGASGLAESVQAVAGGRR
jgi:hypothetical protein